MGNDPLGKRVKNWRSALNVRDGSLFPWDMLDPTGGYGQKDRFPSFWLEFHSLNSLSAAPLLMIRLMFSRLKFHGAFTAGEGGM